MFDQLREFLRRHPAVCDALRWSIPAILFGLVLRALLLSYLPYAHWGSDSRSYYGFAHQLLTEGEISLGMKRRYVYPILMLPVSLLPGAPLQWVAWLQHAMGLASIVPLAYAVRKTIVHWRLAIVPVTVVFAGLPIFLWYEHEMLGEAVFYHTLVWAFAAWIAWATAGRRERAVRLFWLFFVAFAAFLLTKPSGRFAVPGLLLGLLVAGRWRTLTRRQVIAGGAVAVAMLGMGAREHGAWLLYVSAFPLTQLDTPLHAAHKAQIRDLVEPLRRELEVYWAQDEVPFNFLEKPDRLPDRPLWNALADDNRQRARIYMDLALEAIRREPLLFLYLGAQRIVVAGNMSEFKESKFASETEVSRFANDYRRAEEEAARGRHSQLHRVLGFGKGEALPPWEKFQTRMQPRKDTPAERFLLAYARNFARALDLVRLPQGPSAGRSVLRARVLLPGWWLLVALPLALLPRYRATLGVWVLVAMSYLWGVFLTTVAIPRYFAPVWPILLVVMALPLDALLGVVAKRWRRA
jgi:hypothetical protein